MPYFQSGAAATIFFCPLLKAATIRGQLLIGGGIYLAKAKLACCSSVRAFFSKLHNSASKERFLITGITSAISVTVD